MYHTEKERKTHRELIKNTLKWFGPSYKEGRIHASLNEVQITITPVVEHYSNGDFIEYKTELYYNHSCLVLQKGFVSREAAERNILNFFGKLGLIDYPVYYPTPEEIDERNNYLNNLANQEPKYEIVAGPLMMF